MLSCCFCRCRLISTKYQLVKITLREIESRKKEVPAHEREFRHGRGLRRGLRVHAGPAGGRSSASGVRERAPERSRGQRGGPAAGGVRRRTADLVREPAAALVEKFDIEPFSDFSTK